MRTLSSPQVARKAETMLWVVLAGMTGLAALAALWPLVSGRRRVGAGASDAAFYQAQLGEIERDVERGQLPAEEAAGARDRSGAPADRRQRRRRALKASRPLAPTRAAVCGGGDRAGRADRRARALRAIGRPDLPDAPLAERPIDAQSPAGVEAALAQGRARARRLAQRRPRLGGGRAGLHAARPLRRRRQRLRAIACGSTARAPQTRADYGEALVGAAGGIVTADARAAFDKALAEQPDLASPSFYLGLAAEQDGDKTPRRRRLSRRARRRAAGRELDAMVKARLAALEGAPARAAAGRGASARRPAGDDRGHGRTAGDAPRQAWRRC